MSSQSFRPGWYEVAFDPKTYGSRCRFFRTRSMFTAECQVDSNGRQYLLWIDPQGASGAGRPGEWSSAFKALPTANEGDRWDNPVGARSYEPSLPSAAARNLRKPTARELCQRAATADANGSNALICSKEIHVGVFFDGTNNNRDRDKRDNSHSNVVSLFDVHHLDADDHFKYYIPGVDTKFKEVGELGEDAGGKTFAAGGERRIHYAMLQVYNAVCSAATKTDLLTAGEMSDMVTSTFSDNALSTWWRLGDARMNAIFDRIDGRLMKAIEGRRPRITKLHLSVFGFSRGAAEARVFCKWIQMASRDRVGTAALDLPFLGLFDTVASVGLADSGPIGRGFMDWASGNLDIAGVEKTVHFVAAHELRFSFPLSTTRIGKTYGQGTKEYIYPGCHSDIGGGYGPGAQGKARGGRSSLLSQVPLRDMLFEALNAGVRVQRMEEMPAEARPGFLIDTKLDEAFSAYCNWTSYEEKENVATAKTGSAEDRLHYHTQLYWRWRAKVSSDADFKALTSYRSAKAQDQADLGDSEKDWRADVAAAREAVKSHRRFYPRVGYVDLPPTATSVQRELLAQIELAAKVPPQAGAFFDEYVHDSHAGFYLLGAQTEIDKSVFIQSIKDKKRLHDATLAELERPTNPEGAMGLAVLAAQTRLNQFEQRVLASDAKNANQLPVMTDADAADLRDNAGLLKGNVVVQWLLRTGTRRESMGHGHYRAVFDRS